MPGIQWVSRVTATNGWAATIRLSIVVPDRGLPTINTNGLAAANGKVDADRGFELSAASGDDMGLFFLHEIRAARLGEI